MTTLEAAPLAGGPWLRRAELVGVSYPDRLIEVVVMPYEREIDVPHPTRRGGPRCTEIITRGAFDGIERRANRIRANRDHDEARTFGRAATLHPGAEIGLTAGIRVAKTALGDETLALADDGCLDASAAFLPMGDGGLRWKTRTSYRVEKAFLRHIALVPDGAYGEDAGVLAVRQHTPAPAPEPRATPVLERLELDLLVERYERIDARYRHP